jgi:Domain of unknown function (DUF1905)
MKKYQFKAKIEAGDGGGAYVLFPYDTEKEFATKGKVPVKATFNGVPYTGSPIKYGNPLHMTGVRKSPHHQFSAVDVALIVNAASAFRRKWYSHGRVRPIDYMTLTHQLRAAASRFGTSARFFGGTYVHCNGQFNSAEYDHWIFPTSALV